MIAHFSRLFAYDDWANREALASLRAVGTPPPKALERMAHILSAQALWLNRMRQKPQPFPVWPEFTLQQCEAEAAKLTVLWKNYLQETQDAGLAREFVYQNSAGQSWTSRVDDTLMHVIMHSVYHRGQIAADMRAAGFQPAYTDYIHSIRQEFVE